MAVIENYQEADGTVTIPQRCGLHGRACAPHRPGRDMRRLTWIAAVVLLSACASSDHAREAALISDARSVKRTPTISYECRASRPRIRCCSSSVHDATRMPSQ